MVFGNRRIPKHLILENKYDSHKRSGIGAGWILLAIAVIVTSMMFGLKAEAHIAAPPLNPVLYLKEANKKTIITKQIQPIQGQLIDSTTIKRTFCDYTTDDKPVLRCIAFHGKSDIRF